MRLGKNKLKKTVDDIFSDITSKMEELKELVLDHREKASSLLKEVEQHEQSAARGETILSNFNKLLAKPLDESPSA